VLKDSIIGNVELSGLKPLV